MSISTFRLLLKTCYSSGPSLLYNGFPSRFFLDKTCAVGLCGVAALHHNQRDQASPVLQGFSERFLLCPHFMNVQCLSDQLCHQPDDLVAQASLQLPMGTPQTLPGDRVPLPV